jgi:hypothetical protein
MTVVSPASSATGVELGDDQSARVAFLKHLQRDLHSWPLHVLRAIASVLDDLDEVPAAVDALTSMAARWAASPAPGHSAHLG